MTYEKKCDGPVYFADQGIAVCETCGGCTCCNGTVDHRAARHRCLIVEGKCLLTQSLLNHDCERDRE